MFKTFDSTLRDKLTAKRNGETKIGEALNFIETPGDLSHHEAKFVILGIKEDIGIRANLGKGGAAECWDHALPALLNLQSNQFLNGKDLLIAGALEFAHLMEKANKLNTTVEDDLNELRVMTAEIDQMVATVIADIVKAGKIPVIIGGGHNNSYGNIKGTSQTLKRAIPVLNIDPHTDFRALEGRHSGNGFSYARRDNFLGKYAVYGLHENYNSTAIIQQFQEDHNLHYRTFESLIWRDHIEKDHLFKDCLNWFGAEQIGLELDLDSINRFPVSALNPSGFTLNEVRSMVATASALKKPYYLHICEGSPGRASSTLEKEMIGKSIAYIVSDFIKAYG